MGRETKREQEGKEGEEGPHQVWKKNRRLYANNTTLPFFKSQIALIPRGTLITTSGRPVVRAARGRSHFCRPYGIILHFVGLYRTGV